LVARRCFVGYWWGWWGFFGFLFFSCIGFSSFSGSGGLSHELEVLCTSSSNFGGFFNRDGGYERNNFGNCRGNGRNQSRDLRNWGSDWEVGSLNSEPVDGVGDVVDGLNNAIGIDILVAAANISKGVPWFHLGRVDVLVTEAELTELILGVELAGRRRSEGQRKVSSMVDHWGRGHWEGSRHVVCNWCMDEPDWKGCCWSKRGMVNEGSRGVVNKGSRGVVNEGSWYVVN
jgi:hypothetical protein